MKRIKFIYNIYNSLSSIISYRDSSTPVSFSINFKINIITLSEINTTEILIISDHITYSQSSIIEHLPYNQGTES